MKNPPDSLRHLAYPVLKWEPANILLAKSSFRLCGKDTSGFAEDLSHAKRGRTHLFDAKGRNFKIVDYTPVKPFGSFSQVLWANILNEKVYIPVLSNERQLPLSKFKTKIGYAVQDHYLNDYEEEKVVEASLALIAEAKSFRAVLEAVPYFSMCCT